LSNVAAPCNNSNRMLQRHGAAPWRLPAPPLPKPPDQDDPMTRRLLLLYLLCNAALLLPGPAQSASPSDPASDPCTPGPTVRIVVDRLLAPGVTDDDRAAALAEIEGLVSAGDKEAASWLAALHRAGPARDLSPVPRDLSRAAGLLRPLAEAGDLDAMARLAETALEVGKREEALAWAVMHRHFMTTAAGETANAYAQDLVVRAAAGASENLRERAAERANATMRAHGQAMAEAAAKLRPERLEAEASATCNTAYASTPRALPAAVNAPATRKLRPAQAWMLVEIAASGAPTRTWIIDAVPSARTDGQRLVNIARRTRFNAVDAPALRYVTMPIVFEGY
jgi:hypothetical protein